MGVSSGNGDVNIPFEQGLQGISAARKGVHHKGCIHGAYAVCQGFELVKVSSP